MLNPERLELLVELQALQTMKAVADASQMSVSTVSQHIASLERSVGRPLIEHVGRQVRLTPLANELVDSARPVLNKLREIEDMVRSENMEVRGHIRVASFSSALAPLAVPVCASLGSRFPQLTITLEELEPDTSIPLLNAGQLDILFSASFGAAKADNDAGIVSIPLFSDSLCAVLPLGHTLANRTSLRLTDLFGEDWICEPKGTYLSNHIQILCEQAGISPRVTGTLSSYSVVLQSVAQGFGIAVLPRLATQEEPSKTIRVPITPEIRRSVSLITTSSQLSRLSIKHFINDVRQRTRNITEELDTQFSSGLTEI
jgi:DNA-binding transcriptional LysR family regulator